MEKKSPVYQTFLNYGNATYKTKSFRCIYDIKKAFKSSKTPYYFEMHKGDLAITPYALNRFVKALTSWGFPVTINKKQDYYIISFDPKDYTGENHFCAAFTMLRYALLEGVVASYNTEKVIPTMFAYKRKYKHLDLWQCFQIAQYKVMTGVHDHDHACFKTVSTIVPLEILKTKIEKKATVNQLFFNKKIEGYSIDIYGWGVEKTWKDMHKLINENEEEALKILL